MIHPTFDSADVFPSLLPPRSDHVMIHLGGYNCSAWTYSHTVSCNLPSESSLGLDWLAARVKTPELKPYTNFDAKLGELGYHLQLKQTRLDGVQRKPANKSIREQKQEILVETRLKETRSLSYKATEK